MSLPDPKTVEAYASHSLWEQMEFARERFYLPQISSDLVRLKIKSSRRAIHCARRVVRGGRFQFYEIQLNALYITKFPIVGFTEYSRYEKDSEIGAFTTNDWKLYVDATLAHELSHVVQFIFSHPLPGHPLRVPGTSKQFHELGEYEAGHGTFFQAIYRRLRQQFINHRIQDFTLPTKSYVVDDFEDRLKAMPLSPLRGIKTRIGNTDLEIVGLHPDTTKKLFRYVGKTNSGDYIRIRLRDIVVTSREAEQIVMNDPALYQELQDHLQAISRKKTSNARSSLTKRRRR